MADTDIRWHQRLDSFGRACAQLAKAVELSSQRGLSELERQGLIQAFEFTHELAWTTLKDFLESRGTANLFGSKDVTRAAFATGLVEEGEIWMEMIQSRNRTSHTYNEETAQEIAQAITSTYQREFEKLLLKLRELKAHS